MKQLTLFLLFLACAFQTPVHAQDQDLTAIRSVLQNQQNAWNEGNMDAFMSGYWSSVRLKFIGSQVLTYAWKETLANYKKSYPDKAAMAKLTSTLLSLEKLSQESAFVIGNWHLQRDKDAPEG